MQRLKKDEYIRHNGTPYRVTRDMSSDSIVWAKNIKTGAERMLYVREIEVVPYE